MIISPMKHRPGLIADGFFEDAEAVRDYALGADFRPREYLGHTYEGIGDRPLRAEAELEAAVGFPVQIALQFFRIGLAGDNLTVWIHADSVCAEFACVAYLTPDELCRGGTAFWRHKELGWDGLPPEGVDQAMADRLNEDGQDEQHWELAQVVEMRNNRAAIYPTSLFHSRWPRDAVGQTLEEGRLIWCAFFNRRPE